MAVRQGTRRKLAVIFSWRVATARHAFSLAPSRSTRLRLVQIQAGQATAASLLLGGIGPVAGYCPIPVRPRQDQNLPEREGIKR